MSIRDWYAGSARLMHASAELFSPTEEKSTQRYGHHTDMEARMWLAVESKEEKLLQHHNLCGMVAQGCFEHAGVNTITQSSHREL